MFYYKWPGASLITKSSRFTEQTQALTTHIHHPNSEAVIYQTLTHNTRKKTKSILVSPSEVLKKAILLKQGKQVLTIQLVLHWKSIQQSHYCHIIRYILWKIWLNPQRLNHVVLQCAYTTHAHTYREWSPVYTHHSTFTHTHTHTSYSPPPDSRSILSAQKLLL